MNLPGNESIMVKANNYVTADQIASNKWFPITKVPAILFAKVGAAVLLNRKRLCGTPFLLDNNTMSYSLDPSIWVTNFAHALFETLDLTQLVQVGALPSYGKKDVEAIHISIPTLPEQEKIGNLFYLLENAIALHQKKLKHFKNLKESLLQNMFPREGEIFPRLRFPEFTDAWEQRKLIDEVELFGGLTYSPKDVVPSPGSIVLRSSNVKGGEISLDDNVYVLKEKATSTPVQLNDIIVVVRNGSRSLIGKHAIVKAPLNNAVIGAFMTGFRTKQPDFINVLMDTHAFKKAITENLGATINQITGGMLKQMVFFMPASEKEKRAIGNLFRTLDDALALHQRELPYL